MDRPNKTFHAGAEKNLRDGRFGFYPIPSGAVVGSQLGCRPSAAAGKGRVGTVAGNSSSSGERQINDGTPLSVIFKVTPLRRV